MITPNKARSPFRFVTQAGLTQITNWKAKNLEDLAGCLKVVPGSVIYYHTHHFLEQHQSLSPEPPNDFSYWVQTSLRNQQLAEKLAAIDTIRFATIRALREKIVCTIEDSMNPANRGQEAPPGEEFYFMQSVSFVFPTPHESWTIEEFLESLRKVSIHSLYHHIFEARLRHPLGINDFSEWLEVCLGETQLANSIAKLDPYTQTMEGLRQRIIRLVERRILQEQREVQHAVSQ